MNVKRMGILAVIAVLSLSGSAAAESDRDSAIAREMSCVRQHMDQSLSWDDVCYTATKQEQASFEEYNNKNLDMVVEEHNEYYKDYKPSMNKGSDTYMEMPQEQYDSYESTGHGLGYQEPQSKAVTSDIGPMASAKRETATTYNTPRATSIDEHYKVPPSMVVEEPTHTFEFGEDSYYYTYEEPGLMEQDGFMYGLYGLYTFRPPTSDALNSNVIDIFTLEGRFAVGEVDYTSNGTGSIDGEDNYMMEVRTTLGKDFYYSPSVRTTPYMGFGYRYLNNDSAGMQTTTGHWGYERESNYFYLPIGVTWSYLKTNDWSVQGNLEYDWLLFGVQKSHLGDVPGGGYEDVENDQESGFGIRGSVKFIKEVGHMGLILEPFFRYWNIDDSEIVVTSGFSGLEPENETVEVGLKAGIEF